MVLIAYTRPAALLRLHKSFGMPRAMSKPTVLQEVASLSGMHPVLIKNVWAFTKRIVDMELEAIGV